MIVSGIIIIAVILILAIVGSNTAARATSIAEVREGNLANQKVQVSGNVVTNSFSTVDNALVFSIYDAEANPNDTLVVIYEGGVSATFGNDVVAICTGIMGEDGILHASELVTKCPSKYESATNALSISALLGYGEEVVDKPVKIYGTVQDGSLKSAGQGDRFVLVDPDSDEEIAVLFEDALSDEITDGSTLVLTGSITSTQKFAATDVALEG